MKRTCKASRLSALALSCILLLGLLASCGTGTANPGGTPQTPSVGASAPVEESKTPTKVSDEGFVEERDGYTAMTHWVTDDTSKIFGLIYKPADFDESGKYPVVIMSHGIGVTNSDFDNYISHFMNLGIVCYAFDFPGGSMQGKSRGDVKEMSVLTEKSDLLKVISDIKGQSFTDTDKLVLMGGSQGGAVTGLTAPDVAGQIAGEILLYPALCIADNAKAEYPSLDEVPDTINVRGLNLGKVYYEAVWDMDMTAEVTKYTGDVLLIHGTADSAVPYDYSVQAQTLFASAKLVTVENGDHGFTPDEINTFFPEIEQFLTDIGVL